MQRVVHLFIRPAAMTSTETHTDNSKTWEQNLWACPWFLDLKLVVPAIKLILPVAFMSVYDLLSVLTYEEPSFSNRFQTAAQR